MKNKTQKSTSVDKKKSNSQIDAPRSGSKTKSTRRALSQTQKIEEEFEEQLLDISLKKPRRPFNFFIQDMFSKEGGKIDSKTMKDFGKKFKSISEKEKNKYIDLAEKDKDRYDEHLSLVHENLIKKPATEKKTGYHYYVDEQIGKAMEKGEDASEARVKAIEKWNGLDDEQREKYYEMSDKNKEMYEKLRNFRSERISAYMLFQRDKRATAKEKGDTLTLTELSVMWKKSKDSVKEKYEDYAKELKEEVEKNRDMVELTFNMKPTRPKSAYNFFTKDLYQEGEVKGFGKSKQIAEKWEKISDEEREKYQRMAKKERLIYIIKKRNYDAVIRKDIGKAPSALNLFMQDHAGEKMTLQDMYKAWKGSDAATKKKYQKKATEAKEDFQKKMENFKSRVYEPPKRNLGAYNFFFKTKYKDIRASNSEVPQQEMFKIVADAYSKLTEKQLKVYEEMAENDAKEKREYSRQYETFGYYTLNEPKKSRKPRMKRDSVEEGEKPSSKKNNKTKSPTKSTKKGKKN
jgi:hypothetical protein